MAKFKFKTGKKPRKKTMLRYRDVIADAKKYSGTKIEMLSNREISVDGCRKILEYNDVFVKIGVREGSINIVGNSLYIPVYEGPLITICGKISSVEYCAR